MKYLIFFFFYLTSTLIYAQNYALSKGFLQQIQDSSFCQKVNSLIIDTSDFNSLNFKFSNSPDLLQGLKELSNLRSLSYHRFKVGRIIDTIYTFDPNTFEERVEIVESEYDFPIEYLLSELGNLTQLEELSLNFQNIHNWEAYSSLIYAAGLVDEFFESYKGCLPWNNLNPTQKEEAMELFRQRLTFSGLLPNKGTTTFYTDTLNQCLNNPILMRKWDQMVQFFERYAAIETGNREHFSQLQLYGLDNNWNADQATPAIEYLLDLNQQKNAAMANIGLEALQHYLPETKSRVELLSKALKQLPRLKSLRIKNYPDLSTDWPTLISALRSLPQLERLELDNCPIHKIPKSIAYLTRLRFLSWTNSGIQKLEGNWENLQQLSMLELQGNDIDDYGNLSAATQISQLTIDGNRTYPPSLGAFKKLLQLSMAEVLVNDLDAFSSQLQQLHELENLNLSGTTISQWPWPLKELRSLQKVNLSNNALSKWPSDFESWHDMELDISYNCLNSIPFKKMYRLKGHDLQARYSPTKWPHRQIVDGKRQAQLKPMPKSSSIFLQAKESCYILPESPPKNLPQSKNFNVDGAIYGPYFKLRANNLEFNFKLFSVSTEDADYLELYVPLKKRNSLNYPIPKEQFDHQQEAISSKIVGGESVLIIDNTVNILNQQILNKAFPSIENMDTSYIYYQDFQKEYAPDKFFIKLLPFIIDQDQFKASTFRWKGKLHAAGILNELDVEVKIMEHDLSLGFEMSLKEEKLYAAALEFTGNLELSNEGLLAQGQLKHKDWTAKAHYIKLMPDKVLIHAQQFTDKSGEVRRDVQLLYYPYLEELNVSPLSLPFSTYTKSELVFSDEQLSWPLRSTKGAYSISCSAVQKATAFEFETMGQLELNFQLPPALIKILNKDLTGTSDNFTKESSKVAFEFNNCQLSWEEDRLKSNDKQGLHKILYLSTCFGQMVDKSLKGEFALIPNAIHGDQWFLYFHTPAGHWYYFQWTPKKIMTCSSNEEYNRVLSKLKRRQRRIKLNTKGFVEVLPADQSAIKSFP